MKTEIAPALLGAKDSAKFCGIGRTHFLSLVQTGHAPKPTRLGRRTLWRVAELQSWIEAGCPSLAKWEG